MFEEPPLIPESVFSLVDFDEEYGVVGFSEEAQLRFSNCKNIYFIMATGDTGRGKSTKLSQLVNPDFKIVHNKEDDGDLYVFKTSGGPDPSTGFERDGMNFPSIGPLSLSGFKKRWGLPIHPGDEEIALVFVDSQGTNAPIEEARGLILSIGALTTALGLRLCLTDRGRPVFKTFKDVSGGIILNNYIKRGGNLEIGYNIGVINPDVYETSLNDDAHKLKKKEDNEKYIELWKKHNYHLADSPDFKLFMLENPHNNLEGYWDSMKDIAIMISDLAQKKCRDWSSIIYTVNTAITIIQDKLIVNPEYNDFLDPNDLVEPWIESEIDSNFDQLRDFINSLIKQKIDEISDSDIWIVKIDEWNEEISKLAIDQFILIANSIWKNLEEDFPTVYDEAIIDIQSAVQNSLDELLNIRQVEVINKAKESLDNYANLLIEEFSNQAQKEIENTDLNQIHDQNFLPYIISNYVNETLLKFQEEIPKICNSSSVRENHIIIEQINEIKSIIPLKITNYIHEKYEIRDNEAKKQKSIENEKQKEEMINKFKADIKKAVDEKEKKFEKKIKEMEDYYLNKKETNNASFIAKIEIIEKDLKEKKKEYEELIAKYNEKVKNLEQKLNNTPPVRIEYRDRIVYQTQSSAMNRPKPQSQRIPTRQPPNRVPKRQTMQPPNRVPKRQTMQPPNSVPKRQTMQPPNGVPKRQTMQPPNRVPNKPNMQQARLSQSYRMARK